MDEINDTFFSVKISIEPDLGDLRKSTDKALPAPPKTPKRVMMKYRFSAVFPIAFTVASFVLAIVVVLAGQGKGVYGGQYLVALGTSGFGENELGPSAQAVAMPDTFARADFYRLYLRTVCYGSASDTTGKIILSRCESNEETTDRLAAFITSSNMSGSSLSSTVYLATTLKATSDTLDGSRIAIFAFVIISLVSSGLAAISAFPAIFFPHSRLLAYFNIFWPCLASTSAFISASVSTIFIAGVSSVVGGLSGTVSVKVEQGTSVLLLVWLAWLFASLPVLYWSAIWFVEMRRSSFVRRKRSDDEIGNWRDIKKETCGDLRGRDEIQSL